MECIPTTGAEELLLQIEEMKKVIARKERKLKKLERVARIKASIKRKLEPCSATKTTLPVSNGSVLSLNLSERLSNQSACTEENRYKLIKQNNSEMCKISGFEIKENLQSKSPFKCEKKNNKSEKFSHSISNYMTNKSTLNLPSTQHLNNSTLHPLKYNMNSQTENSQVVKDEDCDRLFGDCAIQSPCHELLKENQTTDKTHETQLQSFCKTTEKDQNLTLHNKNHRVVFAELASCLPSHSKSMTSKNENKPNNNGQHNESSESVVEVAVRLDELYRHQDFAMISTSGSKFETRSEVSHSIHSLDNSGLPETKTEKNESPSHSLYHKTCESDLESDASNMSEKKKPFDSNEYMSFLQDNEKYKQNQNDYVIHRKLPSKNIFNNRLLNKTTCPQLSKNITHKRQLPRHKLLFKTAKVSHNFTASKCKIPIEGNLLCPSLNLSEEMSRVSRSFVDETQFEQQICKNGYSKSTDNINDCIKNIQLLFKILISNTSRHKNSEFFLPEEDFKAMKLAVIENERDSKSKHLFPENDSHTSFPITSKAQFSETAVSINLDENKTSSPLSSKKNVKEVFITDKNIVDSTLFKKKNATKQNVLKHTPEFDVKIQNLNETCAKEIYSICKKKKNDQIGINEATLKQEISLKSCREKLKNKEFKEDIFASSPHKNKGKNKCFSKVKCCPSQSLLEEVKETKLPYFHNDNFLLDQTEGEVSLNCFIKPDDEIKCSYSDVGNMNVSKFIHPTPNETQMCTTNKMSVDEIVDSEMFIPETELSISSDFRIGEKSTLYFQNEDIANTYRLRKDDANIKVELENLICKSQMNLCHKLEIFSTNDSLPDTENSTQVLSKGEELKAPGHLKDSNVDSAEKLIKNEDQSPLNSHSTVLECDPLITSQLLPSTSNSKAQPMRFYGCLKMPIQEHVRDIHLDTLTLQDFTKRIIVIQSDSSLHVWLQNSQHLWQLKFSYRTMSSPICKSFLLHSDRGILLLVVTRKETELIFLSYNHSKKIFEAPRQSLHSSLHLDQHLLCGLKGLCCASSYGTIIHMHQFILDETTMAISHQSSVLGEVCSTVKSLSVVGGLPHSLLIYCQGFLYIWNYSTRKLVRKVIMHPEYPTLDINYLWTMAEKGILFILIVGTMNMSACGMFLVVNPITGKWEVVHNYKLSQSEEYSSQRFERFISASVCGHSMITTSQDGADLWSLGSGDKIANLKLDTITCVTGIKDMLLLGLASGCIHMYELI